MPRATNYAPSGFRAITPSLICTGVPRLIDFLKAAFGAEELGRFTDAQGRIRHAAVLIGDSMVELGEANEQWKPMLCGLHYYVPDADAVYKRALAAGGASLYEPTDMPYGDREGGVKDPSGNMWFIATHQQPGQFAPDGFHSITTGFQVAGADRLLAFLERAFHAETVDMARNESGGVGHATLRIADSVVELSEAHGQWKPLTVSIHFYVPDADAAYHSAIAAGGTSLREPAQMDYGERSASVADPCGNFWFIATRTEPDIYRAGEKV